MSATTAWEHNTLARGSPYTCTCCVQSTALRSGLHGRGVALVRREFRFIWVFRRSLCVFRPRRLEHTPHIVPFILIYVYICLCIRFLRLSNNVMCTRASRKNETKMATDVLRSSAEDSNNRTCNRATQTVTRKQRAMKFGRSLVGKKAVITKAIVERWHKRKGRKVRP